MEFQVFIIKFMFQNIDSSVNFEVNEQTVLQLKYVLDTSRIIHQPIDIIVLATNIKKLINNSDNIILICMLYLDRK